MPPSLFAAKKPAKHTAHHTSISKEHAAHSTNLIPVPMHSDQNDRLAVEMRDQSLAFLKMLQKGIGDEHSFEFLTLLKLRFMPTPKDFPLR